MTTPTKKVIRNKNIPTNSKGKTDINSSSKDSKNGKKKNRTKEFTDALIYAAIVAFFIKVFFFEAYRIPTGSMENTLLVGDFLIVTKFTYGSTTPRNIPFTDIRLPFVKLPGFKDPKAGDVVVFDYPGDRDVLQSPVVLNYIKRCVGTPGDTIQVINKQLYRNGEMVPDAPNGQRFNSTKAPGEVEPDIFPKGSGWNKDNYGPLYIPKEGDKIPINAQNYEQWKIFVEREGHDIRLDGENVIVDGAPLPNGEYTTERNYYFMMGDNRDNSADSRYWGFVADDDIVGQALLIYWSWDPSIGFDEFFELMGSVRWDRIGMLIH